MVAGRERDVFGDGEVVENPAAVVEDQPEPAAAGEEFFPVVPLISPPKSR